MHHATFGQDYEPLSGVVQIDPSSCKAHIPVVARADIPGDEAATPEHVVLELLPDAAYRVPNPGEPGRTAAIVITDMPIATLQATQRWTKEPKDAQAQRTMRPADKGKFVVTVRPKPPAPMFVNYVVNRNARKAAQPRDYTLDPPQRVRIDPQTGQGIIWVTPHADNQDEDNERVVLQLRLIWAWAAAGFSRARFLLMCCTGHWAYPPSPILMDWNWHGASVPASALAPLAAIRT